MRCAKCDREMVEEPVKEYSYVQVVPGERYEVLGWWECKCKEYFVMIVPGYTPTGLYELAYTK